MIIFPTVFVPCSLHLIGRSSRTPDKPIRKRVVVDPILVLRCSATPTYSRVSVTEAVLCYNLLVESCRRLCSAFSAGIIEIYMVQSKLFGVATVPFKVVKKRPCRVSQHVAAIQSYGYQHNHSRENQAEYCSFESAVTHVCIDKVI